MKCLVKRTCHKIDGRPPEDSSRPVENWENEEAYILLGPPGFGKTTIFELEAQRQSGQYVTVRDFLTFDERPEWRDTTLFIDGLDEARAGNTDARTPLDKIRAKLDRMGRPRFRLSCREADWLGANDQKHLSMVAPGESVTILRLEPLQDEDIRQILTEDSRVEDPENFLASANEAGLASLLTNPLILDILTRAFVSDGVFPKSRMQAFEKACRTVLQEYNDEHLEANRDHDNVCDLMAAAGTLCAVLLLTGAAGYSLSGKSSDIHFIDMNRLPGQNLRRFRRCLKSNLFENSTHNQRIPAHRQIAEFLGARYLANLVKDGLPIGRILALITGHDGSVVSELRGLSAWFAAHSHNSNRKEVMAHDPLGTVLYGDIGDFLTCEKRQLIDHLQQEARVDPRIITTLQLDQRVGDLVTADMETHYSEILNNPSREDSHQLLIVILIEALQYGECLPKLTEPLMKMLRDNTWWPRIRCSAVVSFIRHRQNKDEAFAELKLLTYEVFTGKVQDSDDSLLGTLLSTLYPLAISESEIMQYLRSPKIPNRLLEYELFFLTHLPKKSNGKQLTILLDTFIEHTGVSLSEGTAYRLSDFFVWLHWNLLARFLRLCGDQVDLNRLFRWLGPAKHDVDWLGARDFVREEPRLIRTWLENRPDEWKTLMAMSIKECIDQMKGSKIYELDDCMYMEEHGRLFGAKRPSDFGFWCLEQSIVAENENAVKWFLFQAANCLYRNEGLSEKDVSKLLTEKTGLMELFETMVVEFKAPQVDSGVSGHHSQGRLRKARVNWHIHVKPHEDKLLENSASPELLDELAKVYFGEYLDVRGSSPKERLYSLLDGDSSLVEAVLLGFRNTIKRNDLPSDKQVMRLAVSNRIHHLVLPFMAGLEETFESAPASEIEIDESFWRLAIAVYYTVPIRSAARHSEDSTPLWFRWILSSHPEIVSDIFAQFVLTKLHSNAEASAELYKLADSTDYQELARLTSMHLLQHFPVRCNSGQLSSLCHLLRATKKHCDHVAFLKLIDKKLSQKSMNVAQRVHWLVAGLCIDPKRYVERLELYVSTSERRFHVLTEAVGKLDLFVEMNCDQCITALRLLIQLIGASTRPYSYIDGSKQGGIVTPQMRVADEVKGFIEKLAMISNKDASYTLETLLSDKKLHPWHPILKNAAYQQKVVRREAEFVCSDVSDVLTTLANGTPANVMDLAALTLEHLQQIARQIRDNDTSDWLQYWNVDSYKRPLETRPEKACRDRLASDLRNRLQSLGISVKPETQYADEKRADICVSYRNCNVPIEVKKSCSRDLWSAIRSQLMARYSRDPGADGHGIYLVFWFGDTKNCSPLRTEDGLSPSTAEEMENHLCSKLLPKEKNKIRICVIDVAKPNS